MFLSHIQLSWSVMSSQCRWNLGEKFENVGFRLFRFSCDNRREDVLFHPERVNTAGLNITLEKDLLAELASRNLVSEIPYTIKAVLFAWGTEFTIWFRVKSAFLVGIWNFYNCGWSHKEILYNQFPPKTLGWIYGRFSWAKTLHMCCSFNYWRKEFILGSTSWGTTF